MDQGTECETVPPARPKVCHLVRLADEYVILRGQVLLHLDVRVVGADALGPLEQLLSGRGGVLPQQRVRSVRQHLLKWIG